MHWMRAIGFTCRRIGKFHHAAQLVSLPARRIVAANPRLDDARNLVLQFPYCRDDALLLLVGNTRFKPECKHVYVHGTHTFPGLRNTNRELEHSCTARER